MLIILTVFFMILAFLTIVAGAITMIIGGEINHRYANKLMVARIAIQGMAILLLAIVSTRLH